MISTRRQAIGAAVASAFLTGSGGCSDQRSGAITRMEVAGPSMAPTFIGAHRLALCSQCLASTRIPRQLIPDKKTFPCPFCGDSIPTTSEADQPADIVTIHSPSSLTRNTQRGDVVAIRRGGFLRLKRLVGLPGDVVDLDKSRLTINGGRISDLMPVASVPVDPNTARPDSWWQPTTSTAWTVKDSTYTAGKNAESQWLVYRHRNVYHNLRPDAVRDNYPGNVNLVRELNVVDKFNLAMNAGNSQDELPGNPQVEVLFWTPAGIRYQATDLPTEMTAMEFATASAAPLKPKQGDLSTVVGPNHPVAVRSPPGTILSGIYLERLVDYRLNKSHDRDRYPIRLGDDQVFVLGDNVPVSVDSRDWGPLQKSDISGIVPSAIK